MHHRPFQKFRSDIRRLSLSPLSRTASEDGTSCSNPQASAVKTHPKLAPKTSWAGAVASKPPKTAGETAGTSAKFRVVVLGAAKVGKSAIIQQLLYSTFPREYSATVEEIHHGEHVVAGQVIPLEILDTSGSIEFPAMRKIALTTGQAFILVYAIDSNESFDQIRKLRDEILNVKPGAPIVVVGNKNDLELTRVVSKEVSETVVRMDWEHCFVECSAKSNSDVAEVFNTVLTEANVVRPNVNQKRRKSLPSLNSLPQMRERSSLWKRNNSIIS